MRNAKLRLSALIFVAFCAFVPTSPGAGDEKLSPSVERFLASGASEKIKVWVYFRDRGERSASDIARALSEVKLAERALKRRQNRSTGPLVDVRDTPVHEPYLNRLRDLGVDLRRTSRYLNAASVEATAGQIRRISRLAFVSRIDRVHRYHRRLPEEPVKIMNAPPEGGRGNRQGDQDGRIPQAATYGGSYKQLDLINVIPLHDNNLHGEGVLVAMLDTGFNRSHEALDHLDIVAEWDFIFEDSVTKNEYPEDVGNQHDHGTCTLSALAGYAPGNLIGPAWAASFILAKTERKFEEVQAEEDDYVRALEWAESLGADVVSSSLGYFDWYTYEDMDGNTAVTTVAADIAASKGVTVVTAAGNEGPLPWPGIIAPSDGDSVLAIGAVDSNGVVVSWSSRGPTYDGRIKPDVMAMGAAVVSASPSDSLGYLRTSGTSLSTPLVAGSVAILLQMHPYWTPDSVIQALRSNASNAELPDNTYGWGIIDAYASALNGATGILENVALDFEVHGRTVTVSVALRGGGGEYLNIQRARHPGGQGSWSPYEVVRGNVFVDSTSPYTLSQTLAGGLYRYRAQRASDATVVSQHVEVRIPYGFRLSQSYPNPFVQSASAEATIRYTLEGLPSQYGASDPIWAYMDVSLVIYDVRGARVRTLFDGIKPPGEYAAVWNGCDDRGIRVSSGVYYYRLSVGGTSISKKIILLR